MADLNLRIDRDAYQPPERPEKKVAVNESVDPMDSFYELFAEEITGEKREPVKEVRQPRVRQQRREQPEPQPVLQEEVFVPAQPQRERNYIDASADRLSKFIGETGGAVQINEVDERFHLLEAEISKIRQMTKAQFPGNPGNTIVSGIGNSGDGSTQGGGAVWLWDLDDVSIGTPLNGQYPTITDGDVLKYSAGDGKWIAGEGAGANILEGGIINANGGTANTTGNVILQATNVSNGNLEIQKVSSDPTVKIHGATGNTDFKGGFVQIDRLSYNSSIGQSNFTIHGRSLTDINAGTYTNGGNIFYGYTSHPQDTGTADSIQYDGRIHNALDIVNKGYVDSAIDTGGGGIGFNFKGTCDVTLPLDNAANSNVAEDEGNFYINVTGGTAYNSGTAAQNWAGIGGLTISADQLIIWSESNSRWFAGAVENDTTFVKVDGSNPMTGALNIAPSSGSNGLIIKDGSTTTITLFKGGSASITGTITVGDNVIPDSANTGNVGTQAVPFSEVNANKLFAYLDGSQFAAFGPYGTTPNIGGTSTRWGTVYAQAVNCDSTSTMANINPVTLNTGSIGTADKRWENVYAQNINSNSTASLNEVTVSGDIVPNSTAARSIGSSSKHFKEAYINAIETTNKSVMGAIWPRSNGGFSFGADSVRWNTLFANSLNLSGGSFTNTGTMSQTGDATMGRLTVNTKAQFNISVITTGNFEGTGSNSKLQFTANSAYGEIDVSGQKNKKLYFYATDGTGGSGALYRVATFAYEECEFGVPLKVNNVRYENLTGLSQLQGDVQVGTMAMFNGIMYYYGLSGGNPKWMAMSTVNLNPPN